MALDDLGVEAALAEREDALDHGAAAHADMGADQRLVDRAEAVAGKRMVEAGDQVRRGVDQRAVEVEDDDRRAHVLSWLWLTSSAQ